MYWVDLKGSYGLAAGDGQFAYTDNMGQSWKIAKHIGNGDIFQPSGSGFAVDNSPSTIGWIGGVGGKIAKAVKDFDTWKIVKITGPDEDAIKGDVRSIYFRDRDNGLAAGTAGLIAITSSGGEEWHLSQPGRAPKYADSEICRRRGSGCSGGYPAVIPTTGWR